MARPALTFTGPLKDVFPHGLVGIAYDCDGVMVNSAAANRFLYNQILAALGLPAITPEQEVMAFQATFRQALERLTPPEMHGRLDDIYSSVVDYDRDIMPKIEPMPHYHEFVEAAHSHGLKQSLDTNRTEIGARKILDFFHLPPYFDPIMCATKAEPKPSPDGPRRICEAWDALPGQVLFAGDSESDAEAARGAGLVFCGFGGIAGDITVNSWPELAETLWGGKDANITRS